ncbi:MAG: ferritin family protein [Candidatus Aminicenantia bacterium]
MKNITTSSIKELLGIAIKAEIDSNKVYSHLSNSVENPLLKEKFQMLANEENKHKILLERFFETLYHNKKIPIPDTSSQFPTPKISSDPSTPFVEIIYQAMNFEKESQQFYLELSKKFENRRRSVFEYLSKVEESHYMMLKSEYEIAQEFEDYPRMKEFDRIVT